MSGQNLPLEEVSIYQLFMENAQAKYEIPIYQRNYAWEKDEIAALIQDVYDAYTRDAESNYYIGTLVSYYRGENVYEIIDGQQRLTTIRILLSVLEQQPSSKLTYKARKRSDETLKHLENVREIDEAIGVDDGIRRGFKFALDAYTDIVPQDERAIFKEYFLQNVKIIHYRVPKDIDLNHYFEVMNSRGEQLEKHEIVKSWLCNGFRRKHLRMNLISFTKSGKPAVR